MDPAVYSATSSLEAALRAQDVVAHNLANVNTPGFKRRLVVFQAQLAAAMGQAGTQPDEVVVDFSRGPAQQTGNPLDLMLDCEGFFVLSAGPDSGYIYTRKGNFSLSADGAIVDSMGRPLLGNGGAELRVPRETREIRIDEAGQVVADGASIGRVWVVDVPKPRPFVPAAYTAFALPPDAPAPETVADAVVVQGTLEGSNTNPVDELVSMIATLRNFEASQRALRSIDESLEQMSRAAGELNA